MNRTFPWFSVVRRFGRLEFRKKKKLIHSSIASIIFCCILFSCNRSFCRCKIGTIANEARTCSHFAGLRIVTVQGNHYPDEAESKSLSYRPRRRHIFEHSKDYDRGRLITRLSITIAVIATDLKIKRRCMQKFWWNSMWSIRWAVCIGTFL